MTIIGQEIDLIDTPALWVDLDRMEANIRMLAEFFREAGVAWRPHTKGIKIPALAHKCLAAGAIGVTCAKLSEAEVMASAGITDILIANQVVGAQKITRLVRLRRHADVMVCLDSIHNAREISEEAVRAGAKVRVLAELDTGMGRCGLKPAPAVVDFVGQVAGLPGLEFNGLMGWEGHVVRMTDPSEKRQAIEQAVGSLVQSADLCRQAGFEVKILSCGGTGSYRITAHIPGVTEVQAGGGVFGDVAYRTWGAGLECSLHVMATVISVPEAGRVVIDAGRKALNFEIAQPEVVGLEGVLSMHASAEHTVLQVDPGKVQLQVGDKIHLIAGYGDLTVFLYDQLIGVRQGRVEQIWDILGRGKLT